MRSRLNFRSIVFQRAYRIVKETGCGFANALKAAWNRYREYKNRISAELAERINHFDFYFHYSDDRRVYQKWSKEDESIRGTIAILPASFIPAIASQLYKAQLIQEFI